MLNINRVRCHACWFASSGYFSMNFWNDYRERQSAEPAIAVKPCI